MTGIFAQPLAINPFEKTSARRFEDHYTTRDPRASRVLHQIDSGHWKPRTPVSPDEMSSSKEEDPSHARNMGQGHDGRPNQSLPPISSIFGPTPLPRSPQSEGRHSPIPTSRPQSDSRYQHTDRLQDLHYHRPPALRQVSFNSRPQFGERLGFPSGPRPRSRDETGSVLSRHAYSQGYNEAAGPALSIASRSPPRSERREIFSRDHPPSFRPGAMHHAPPANLAHYAGPGAAFAYNPPILQRQQRLFPPAPGSVGEGITATKDGLGPKIWTGTYFLPRFVRQADVPGEGLCYFYDDGTHCKTVIDGEPVNAHWGVTKAGKPRKRLAIACITCREKKIKCDPDYPRCIQCEKFGRICKFKNAPRGGVHGGSPETPPAELDEGSVRRTPPRKDGQATAESVDQSPRPALRRVLSDLESQHSKRRRTDTADQVSLPSDVAGESPPRAEQDHEPVLPSVAVVKPLVTRPIDHAMLREWQIDPFTQDPTLARDLLDVFFKHVPEIVHYMFPEWPFRAWAQSSVEKSLDDLMLIYNILALSTVFSPRTEHKAYGIKFACVARYACDNRHFSVQLVQSRSLLSLYYFATANPGDAWDFCGSALRAASGLKLNLELEKGDDAQLPAWLFGLNRAAYAECRRRTFWSCYTIDRFNGYSSGHTSIVNSEDIFLRLPSDTPSFEDQEEVENPYFDPTLPPIQPENGTKFGLMSYLMPVTTIYGDVMGTIYRTAQRPESADAAKFAEYFNTATSRLDAWRDSLPANLIFNAENVKKRGEQYRLGAFMTMHSIYHLAVMRLNRYVPRSARSSSEIEAHIATAKHHAKLLLEMQDILCEHRPITPTACPDDSTLEDPSASPNQVHKFSSPFAGNALVCAMDIISARVSPSEIPGVLESFSGARTILGELTHFWMSSRAHQGLVLQRVSDLKDLETTERPVDERSTKGGEDEMEVDESGKGTETGKWALKEPLEKNFRSIDCVYS